LYVSKKDAARRGSSKTDANTVRFNCSFNVKQRCPAVPVRRYGAGGRRPGRRVRPGLLHRGPRRAAAAAGLVRPGHEPVPRRHGRDPHDEQPGFPCRRPLHLHLRLLGGLWAAALAAHGRAPAAGGPPDGNLGGHSRQLAAGVRRDQRLPRDGFSHRPDVRLPHPGSHLRNSGSVRVVAASGNQRSVHDANSPGDGNSEEVPVGEVTAR